MLAVLSPAKRLDFETPPPAALTASEPRFLRDTAELLETAKALRAKDLCTLMKISDGLGELNEARFQAMHFPLTAANAKPAVLAFRGDTYMGLEASTFDETDFTFAQDHLRILSGLFGLLRPLDLIQPYRLEMGTKLKNPRGRDLYQFWGPRLVDSVNEELEHHDASVLVNLASVEYFKALEAEKLRGRLVNVAFKEMRGGTPKIISFSAKKARGMMAQFIVKQRIDRPEDLVTFDMAGYRYRGDLSTPDHLEFVREAQ